MTLSAFVRWLYHVLFAGFNSGCLLALSSVVPGRIASLHVSALAQSRGGQQSGTDPPVPCTEPRSVPTIYTNTVCQFGERLVYVMVICCCVVNYLSGRYLRI